MLLQAINFIDGPSYEVVISGQYKKSEEIINYIHSIPQPNKVLIFNNIEKTLDQIGINFDNFYNEQSLYEDEKIFWQSCVSFH